MKINIFCVLSIILAIVLGIVLFQKYNTPKILGISYKPINTNVGNTMRYLNNTIAQFKSLKCSPVNKKAILDMISAIPVPPPGMSITCKEMLDMLLSSKYYSELPKDLGFFGNRLIFYSMSDDK